MAILITPSKKLSNVIDTSYAQVGDEVMLVNKGGKLVLSLPYAQPTPPPYSCRAYVNTAGVTDLSNAWAGCTSITEVPVLNVDSCVNFESAFQGCTSLTTFPPHVFDNCECSNFTNTWVDCALSQQSVDNILVSLDVSGVTGGVVDITGGTNSRPSSVGRAAAVSLRAKGWTVNIVRICDQPPYNCNTDVDTYCVTDFFNAWAGCQSITSFPMLDVSSGTSFWSAWFQCANLEYFPLLDVSSGTNFRAAWFECANLESFPLLDVSSGTIFEQTWANCFQLTSFPPLDLSSGTKFNVCWYQCLSLTSFPANMFDICQATNFNGAWSYCALSQQSVDNILVSIDTAGQLNGTLGISGGTSSTPSTAGWTAYDNLVNKGWTVTVNGTRPSSNYLPYPNDFQRWDVWTGQMTTDQIAAPDGTMTADKWVAGEHDYYGQRVAFYDLYPPNVPQIPTGSTCTASIYVKRFGSENRNIQIDLWWACTVNFNLDNPSGSVVQYNASALNFQHLSVDNVGNGWYRCYFTLIFVSQPAWYFRYHLRILDNNLVSNYPGNDTSGLYLWNAEFGISNS